MKNNERIFLDEFRSTIFKMIDEDILKEILHRNRFELRVKDQNKLLDVKSYMVQVKDI